MIFVLKKIGVEDFTKHFELIKHNLKINASVKNNSTTYYDETSMKAINEIYKDDFENLGFTKYENVDDLNAFLTTYNNEETNNIENQTILTTYSYVSPEIDEEDIFDF